MNRLIINTVLPTLQIVLDMDGKVSSITLPTIKKHNEMLLGCVDEILKQNKLNIADISEVCCFVGPGSFTGIRVGVASVKAFRDGLGIDAYGINTLQYLAQLARASFPDAEVFALYGSMDSYFVYHIEDGKPVMEKVNQTWEQLSKIAHGRQIYTFACCNTENMVGVELDDTLLAKFASSEENKSKDLTPVYFQLSQAESQKISRDVDIVDAKLQDLEWLVNVDHATFEDKYSIETYRTALDGYNHKILLAKLFEQNIGYIYLDFMPDEVAIAKIAVLPEYRRNNVAKQLLQRSIQLANEKGLSVLSLEVSSNNTPALELYKSTGFKVRRTRNEYYKDHSDALEMYLDIRKTH